jgi:hypothetical protein
VKNTENRIKASGKTGADPQQAAATTIGGSNMREHFLLKTRFAPPANKPAGLQQQLLLITLGRTKEIGNCSGIPAITRHYASVATTAKLPGKMDGGNETVARKGKAMHNSLSGFWVQSKIHTPFLTPYFFLLKILVVLLSEPGVGRVKSLQMQDPRPGARAFVCAVKIE